VANGNAKTQTRELLEMKAEILQAVAHPIRLAVVECLRDGETCVCDLAERVGAGRSNLSRHLAVMSRAGVVQARRDGLRMMYSLRTPCIVKFLTCVTDVLRHKAKAHADLLGRLT
jgi:ArsR family transcriptional regulator